MRKRLYEGGNRNQSVSSSQYKENENNKRINHHYL